MYRDVHSVSSWCSKTCEVVVACSMGGVSRNGKTFGVTTLCEVCYFWKWNLKHLNLARKLHLSSGAAYFVKPCRFSASFSCLQIKKAILHEVDVFISVWSRPLKRGTWSCQWITLIRDRVEVPFWTPRVRFPHCAAVVSHWNAMTFQSQRWDGLGCGCHGLRGDEYGMSMWTYAAPDPLRSWLKEPPNSEWACV